MHPYGVLQDTVHSVMVAEFMSRTDINGTMAHWAVSLRTEAGS